MTRTISGLNQIIEQIDAVLVDQYGVLHDGKKSFIGAVDCLKELKRLNIPVVAITNSGRLKESNKKRLDSFGFSNDLLQDIVTSGEVTRRILKQMIRDGDLRGRDKILCISRNDDTSLVKGLGLAITTSQEESIQLIVIAGVMPEIHTRQYYSNHLKKYAGKDIPAICANPDLIMYTKGLIDFGPGQIAEDYKNLGGSVTVTGKPSIEIFSEGLTVLGNPDPARTLVIGDSPYHDIAGGVNAGCKTLLIKSGVQAELGSQMHKSDFSMELLVF